MKNFGQTHSELKSGIYEYIKVDTILNDSEYVSVWSQSSDGYHGPSEAIRLIVNNRPDSVMAELNIRFFIDNFPAYAKGSTGDYSVRLVREKEKNLYRGHSDKIEFIVSKTDDNEVELEILGGKIIYFYSGGQHINYEILLLPEKYKLVFVGELTKEETTNS
jgi:hypothetical protein